MQTNIGTDDDRTLLVIEHTDGSMKSGYVINKESVLDYLSHFVDAAAFIGLDMGTWLDGEKSKWASKHK